jgi:hypothetical protein
VNINIKFIIKSININAVIATTLNNTFSIEFIMVFNLIIITKVILSIDPYHLYPPPSPTPSRPPTVTKMNEKY